MAYDLAEHKMNFTLNDIELFVEIGQVGLHKEAESLFAHSRGGAEVCYDELFYFSVFHLACVRSFSQNFLFYPCQIPL